MRSVELFAGAGGLALGTAAAGFRHEAVLEWNKDCISTIQENQSRGVKPVCEWPGVKRVDVRGVDFKPYEGIDLLSGGPPCQPFSIGGKHRGDKDARNLFPEVVRAVRETRPKAVLIENVKGLLRPKFANFFHYVLLQLRYPDLVQKNDEDWAKHLSRLERHHSRTKKPDYIDFFHKANAADYGVPQKRERVFIVAFRADLTTNWSFPQPTHSQDALLVSQWVTGEYWDTHKIANKDRPAKPVSNRLAKLKSGEIEVNTQPWLTVRDTIADLPDPRNVILSSQILNHWANQGARTYEGHTGSPLDEPAKTLKAGDHGVPGGENMLSYPNGKVRYFTVREAARLQTFPDGFYFAGAWTEAMRQIGNAVPVRLAQAVAASVKNKLSGGDSA